MSLSSFSFKFFNLPDIILNEYRGIYLKLELKHEMTNEILRYVVIMRIGLLLFLEYFVKNLAADDFDIFQ